MTSFGEFGSRARVKEAELPHSSRTPSVAYKAEPESSLALAIRTSTPAPSPKFEAVLFSEMALVLLVPPSNAIEYSVDNSLTPAKPSKNGLTGQGGGG